MTGLSEIGEKIEKYFESDLPPILPETQYMANWITEPRSYQARGKTTGKITTIIYGGRYKLSPHINIRRF